MRRLGFSLLICSLVGAVGVACHREPARPHVLLVTIDTLRADHCSTYGYEPDTTPVLTKLAKSGLLFRHAYAPSATTAPSHAALLTGRHFRALGVMKNGHVVPDDALTIAETLAEQGYATAGFVSSFPVREKFGFAQGFEVYDDRFTSKEASVGRQKARVAHDRRAEATVDHFGQWLSERDDDRPLFAWVHFVDPHFPYRAPEPFHAKWPPRVSGIERKYDGEVRYADKQLGRLVEMFERAAGGAGALIIVTSDHGEGLGDHNWKSHGINLYEEAVRVPLVARWPGRLPEGKVVEEPVSLVDIVPSILSVIGAKPLPVTDGVDMFGPLDPGRPIFLQRRAYKNNEVRNVEVAGEMTAVVQHGNKYIVAPEEKRRELYDLGGDPRELKNLLGAGEKGHGSAPADAAAGAGAAPAAAAGAAPESAAPGRDPAAAAAAYDAQLERWREGMPMPENDSVLDQESLRALRSLGYVE